MLDRIQRSPGHLDGVDFILPEQTRHDGPGMLVRRAGSYVDEIREQGHEDPAFGLAHLGQPAIAGADEPLIVCRSGLVSDGP